MSIRCTERLAEANIEFPVCSLGDSYDNAPAETINGPFKAEVIYRQFRRSVRAVELDTLQWVDWFEIRRLLKPIGSISPAEAKAACYAALEAMPFAVQRLNPTGLRKTRRGSHRQSPRAATGQQSPVFLGARARARVAEAG